MLIAPSVCRILDGRLELRQRRQPPRVIECQQAVAEAFDHNVVITW